MDGSLKTCLRLWWWFSGHWSSNSYSSTSIRVRIQLMSNVFSVWKSRKRAFEACLISIKRSIFRCQSLTVWPDFAKFHHFGKYLKVFGNIFKVYLVLGIDLKSLWHNLYAFVQIFIAINGQILKTQSGHTDRWAQSHGTIIGGQRSAFNLLSVSPFNNETNDYQGHLNYFKFVLQISFERSVQRRWISKLSL